MNKYAKPFIILCVHSDLDKASAIISFSQENEWKLGKNNCYYLVE